jgi:hypothetical protein
MSPNADVPVSVMMMSANDDVCAGYALARLSLTESRGFEWPDSEIRGNRGKRGWEEPKQ